jgi:hypothetical protein
MKNKHLLLITATVAFLTFYVPVVFFTKYTNHIPLWTLPLFWILTQIPFWFHEIMWRLGRVGTDSYNMFHQLHYEGKEWKNKKTNIWLVVSKFFKWWIKEPICIIGTGITLTSLGFGLFDMFNEEMHPFSPYYVFLSLWWIYFVLSFREFKEKVKYGYISYGEYKKSTTHFSQEWYSEQERLHQLNEERRLNSKK